MDDFQKARLTSALVNQRIRGVEWPVVTPELVEEARSAPQLAPECRAARLLRHIAQYSSGAIGRWVPILDISNLSYWEALAWSDSVSWNEVAYLCEYLSEKKWIKLTRFDDGSLDFRVLLTVEGHSRVAALNAASSICVNPDHTDNVQRIVESPVATNLHDAYTREYDFFISHASEDKEDFVRQLAESLALSGAKVWYDEFTLKVGDSLRLEIDRGLANSRFGIVVLSDNFFKKEWPVSELNGLVTLQMQGQGRILPIWHKVSKEEISRFSPTLADRVALRTAAKSVEAITTELMSMLRE